MSSVVRCAAVLLLVFATGAAAVVLPQPVRDPLSIDFASDPVLSAARAGIDDGRFVASLSAAVVQHPAVTAALAAQAEERQVRAEVRSAYLPQVEAQVTGDRSLARNFSNDPDNVIERSKPRERVDGRLVADQLLLDFGATGARSDAATARLRAAAAQVAAVAGQTAVAAAAACADLATAQALTGLGEGFVARHRDILGKVRQRARQGFGSLADVARVESYLADAEARASRTRRQLAGAEARYRELFGGAAPTLARPPRPVSSAANADAAEGLAASRPAVAVSRAIADAARRDLSAARADRLPRLSAQLDATQYDFLDKGDEYDVRARVVLRQRLFGGADAARVGQARARADQASSAATRATGEAERDAATAFADAAELDAQVAALGESYRASRRSRDLFVASFEAGRGSLLDVLQAERDYYNAAADLLTVAAELDTARWALLERTGELLDRIGLSFSIDGRTVR